MPEATVIRPEKQEAVAEIAKKLSAARSVFLTDYSGLTVEAVTRLRRNLRKSNVEFQVSKNTLTRLAAKEVGFDDILPFLEGPTALAYGMGDPSAPAKVITEFLKTSEKPKIKAIVFEGKFFDAKETATLTNLPSREQLLAQLVGSLNSPMAGLVGSLQGVMRKLVYALEAVAESKKPSES